MLNIGQDHIFEFKSKYLLCNLLDSSLKVLRNQSFGIYIIHKTKESSMKSSAWLAMGLNNIN